MSGSRQDLVYNGDRKQAVSRFLASTSKGRPVTTPTRKLWLTLLPLVVACALLAYSTTSASGTLTAHFINVGQGDCCWLHLPNGDDILVDGGKPQGGPDCCCLFGLAWFPRQ